MAFKPSYKIGATVTHAEICAEFHCANMGGMRRAKATNTLVIISDPTKSLYDDKWHGDTLHYTGMGKVGDQVLDGNQNRTLFDSDTNGIEVHLFEVLEARKYIYHGPVKLAGSPYQEVQKDDTGTPRKVWVFPVRPMETVAVDHEAFKAYEDTRKAKARALTKTELKAKAEECSKKEASSRNVTTTTYVRDQNIAEYSKEWAEGICQLCGNPAPFQDSNGRPYLESHHIIWLAAGGADSVDNTIALCPNCHRKMHVVNDPADVRVLLEKVKRNLEV
jgi:5-methylcytosine-specific restriction protein A